MTRSEIQAPPSDTFSNRDGLLSAGYGLGIPFQLEIASEKGKEQIACSQVLRLLPGKRVVVRGHLAQTPVVAKVYLSERSRHRHVRREEAGLEALRTAGIAVPNVLRRTCLVGDDTPVVVFEDLPGARSLGELLAASATGNDTLKILQEATRMVAAMHNKGVLQRDIHPDNFLFSSNRLYCIDAESVDSAHAGEPLGQWPSLVNLGLFLAQFPGGADSLCPKLFDVYAQDRGWADAACLFDELERHINEQWNVRKNRYLKKIYRSSTEHIVEESWGRFCVWRRDRDSRDLRNFLEDPDGYMEGGRLLKRGNSSTVALVSMNGEEVVVKRYNLKNLWHRLRRCLRNTRASTSWRNAHLLRMAGVHTPDPLVLLEKRWGPFRGTAYYVMRYIAGRHFLSLYEDVGSGPDCASDPHVSSFVGLLRIFRQHGLVHGDMKATNFIFADGSVWVMDLDAMTEVSASKYRARGFENDCQRWLQNWTDRPGVEACYRSALIEAGLMQRTRSGRL